MTLKKIRWGRITWICALMCPTAIFGFLAALTGNHAWLVPQVVTWIAALALLLLSGAP